MRTKEQVKALWNLCFDDSEAFVEMYFSLRYKNEINISIESGNELISALQMIPYPMTFCDNTIRTSYISGACTHPEFRGKGVMRELLSQAFTQMYHSGVHLTTLIPAEPSLFGYYAQTGYASVFQYSTRELVVPNFIPSKDVSVATETEYKDDIYQYINQKLVERTCCIQHTSEDFKVILADLSLSNGFLFVARIENMISGIAIVYKKEKEIIISELFAENKDAEHSLLHYIKEYTGCKKMIELLTPNQSAHRYELGMARVINAKEMLQLYSAAYPEDEMQLEIQDKQLSVNNGYYYLCNGKCMYSTERLPGTHIQMNIKELSERIFQPSKPYMSLMLNK